MRALENARLDILLCRRPGGASLDASFRVEALNGAAANAPASPSRVEAPVKAVEPPAPARPPQAPLAHVVHVARRGDVRLGWEEWAGGPQTPAPVEGMELAAGCELQAQALVAGADRWTEWAGPGAYVGTRGRGLPLLGLRLRVTGPNAEVLEAAAEALFLGSPVVVRRGRAIEFLSPTGKEPLVGLKLYLPRVADAAPPALRQPPSKLRVFRNLSNP